MTIPTSSQPKYQTATTTKDVDMSSITAFCSKCGERKSLTTGNDSRLFCTERCRKKAKWSDEPFPHPKALCNECGQQETHEGACAT